MKINIVEFLKPILSNRTPDTVGPIKAPKAKVDVHIPETNPYVSIEFGNPQPLKFNFIAILIIQICTNIINA